MSDGARILEGGPERQEPALLDAWRALAEARSNPFLTPEWCRAWLETHPGEAPFLIAWEADGELRGVLPLVSDGGRLRFAGARRGDWFEPACAPVDEAAMGSAVAALLAAERSRWNLLELDRIDDGGSWPEALWKGGGLAPAQPRKRDVLPFIALEEGGYEGYLAGRSRNFRSQLGRRRRKLEKEHELGFRLTATAADVEPDVEAFFALHRERWAERGGSSSDEEATLAFQRRFAALAQERGWLRLWICTVDGEPAAAWYGWRIGVRYCYALSGLAKRWEEAALGTVLLAHTIEAAAAEGAEIYDMMWGDEGYKKRFESGRREADSWVLGRRRSPVALAAAARTALERRARSARGH